MYYLKPAFLFLIAVPFLISPVQKKAPLTDISTLSPDFYYDIRYATTYNFMGEVLYDCARCLLLPEVATALNNANYYFCDQGYAIKIFDCYRPLSVQKKMWKKVANPIYVADPARGSVHNRAAAVDLTLVKRNGDTVNMGTDYDHFGRAAHIDNFNLPEEVLANRKMLREGMKQFGFETIQSEWWHFSFQNKSGAPLLDTPLDCNE